MKLLILDNYDSFTYNLVQYLRELEDAPTVEIFRNDEISLDEVGAYDAIVLSPGPGLPAEAGIMPELIQRYAATKPILGVCLGHQAIGEAFGGSLRNLDEVYHGISSPMHVTVPDAPLLKGLTNPFDAGRYHSWVIEAADFPAELQVTARDEKGEIMALQHREYNLHGVQFHPESIMTDLGRQLLQNFVDQARLDLRS